MNIRLFCSKFFMQIKIYKGLIFQESEQVIQRTILPYCCALQVRLHLFYVNIFIQIKLVSVEYSGIVCVDTRTEEVIILYNKCYYTSQKHSTFPFQTTI